MNTFPVHGPYPTFETIEAAKAALAAFPALGLVIYAIDSSESFSGAGIDPVPYFIAPARGAMSTEDFEDGMRKTYPGNPGDPGAEEVEEVE